MHHLLRYRVRYKPLLQSNIRLQTKNTQHKVCCLFAKVLIQYSISHPRLTCFSWMSESGSGLQAGSASRTSVKICRAPKEIKTTKEGPAGNSDAIRLAVSPFPPQPCFQQQFIEVTLVVFWVENGGAIVHICRGVIHHFGNITQILRGKTM